MEAMILVIISILS